MGGFSWLEWGAAAGIGVGWTKADVDGGMWGGGSE